MNRLYTAVLLVVATVLLGVFRSSELARFWNADLETTGRSHQERFFTKPLQSSKMGLRQVDGRLRKSEANRLVYQFRVPADTEIYLEPQLVRQSGFLDQQQQRRSYRNLKRLQLLLPKRPSQTLFDITQEPRRRIALSPLLGQTPLFELVLDQGEYRKPSERVIGSFEIILIERGQENSLPDLPNYLWFMIAPVIWAWFFNRGLHFSLAPSLALSMLFALGAHISWIFSGSTPLLVWASALAALLILALRSLFEEHPLPTAPFFWGLLGWGIQLRWQEIILSAARPLTSLPEVQRYYQHALTMDLFSSKGFFSALYPQGPLYPFLLKSLSTFFGFSGFHMFYLSLLCGIALLVLSYRLARQILHKGPLALGVMALLSYNPLLIAMSAQRSPDTLSACLELALLLLIFAPLSRPLLRGVLRGGLLLLLLWSHLAFLPWALLLLSADFLYQQWRSEGALDFKISLKSTGVSLLIIGVGFVPALWQNWQIYRSFVPESTAYVSRIGNLEFADQAGFPASLDIIQHGASAPGFQRLEIRQYFLKLHRAPEVIGAGLLGLIMLSLDSVGALFHLSNGENILSVLIHGLSSGQNILPLAALLLLEVILTLGFGVFAWLRYRRYRFLLVLIGLMLTPHAFFFGIFLLKGLSLQQSQLDQQGFLFVLPVLAIMTLDGLAWSWRHLSQRPILETHTEIKEVTLP